MNHFNGTKYCAGETRINSTRKVVECGKATTELKYIKFASHTGCGMNGWMRPRSISEYLAQWRARMLAEHAFQRNRICGCDSSDSSCCGRQCWSRRQFRCSRVNKNKYNKFTCFKFISVFQFKLNIAVKRNPSRAEICVFETIGCWISSWKLNARIAFSQQFYNFPFS